MFAMHQHRRFSPRDISGLVVMLDAANIRGLADSDPVSTWPDATSNARDYTGFGSTRPQWKSGVINGWPAVRFDGTDDYLSRSDAGYPHLVAHSLLVAAAPSITSMSTGEERSIHAHGTRSIDQLSCILVRDDGSLEGLTWTPYNSATPTLTLSPLNQWFVGSLVTTGVGPSVPVTVTMHTASSAASTNPAPNGAVFVGGGAFVGQHGGGAGYFAGDIHFVAVWSRSLTVGERILASQWIARRLGIAVNS